MRTQEILGSCLIEGDPKLVAGRRRAKRAALLLSLLLQAVALSFLLLTPLFAKTERLTWKNAIPIPPYKGSRQPNARPVAAQPPAGQHGKANDDPAPAWIQPLRIPKSVYDGPIGPEAPAISNEPGACTACDPDGLIPLLPSGRSVPPLLPPRSSGPGPTPIRVSGPVQEALLIHRVQPQYTALMRQIRLEGRVELRAIIARDGTVQSLELISGHPLLAREALAAIQQWRYRPTLIGGEPVEVETRISVVFTLQR